MAPLVDIAGLGGAKQLGDSLAVARAQKLPREVLCAGRVDSLPDVNPYPAAFPAIANKTNNEKTPADLQVISLSRCTMES